jgi:hypothetical protein
MLTWPPVQASALWEVTVRLVASAYTRSLEGAAIGLALLGWTVLPRPRCLDWLDPEQQRRRLKFVARNPDSSLSPTQLSESTVADVSLGHASTLGPYHSAILWYERLHRHRHCQRHHNHRNAASDAPTRETLSVAIKFLCLCGISVRDLCSRFLIFRIQYFTMHWVAPLWRLLCRKPRHTSPQSLDDHGPIQPRISAATG